MSAPIEVPVLIVGGGGCGLAASIFLSDLGVRSLMIERNPTTTDHPRAHILNQRSMEIFRQHQCADEIYHQSTPPANMERITFRTSLGGDGPLDRKRIGDLDAYGGGALRERYDADSACFTANVPLMTLEPLLRGIAELRAPGQVRFHHELVSFQQDDNGVDATIRDHANGTDYRVRARYLIAADGGKTVGRALGLGMQGPRGLRKMVNTFFSADLSRWIDDDGALLRYFINPDGRGQWAGGGLLKTGPTRWDRHSESWVFMRELSADDPEVIDEANVVARMRELLRLPDVPITVHKIGRWDVEGVIAERFRVGRIFVAGDAAHRHPPLSALGLNTAFGDAHNLAWKLAYVLANQAPDALLDTYEMERKPVGARVAEWALNGFRLRGLIDQAIGLAPGKIDANRQAFEQLYADTEDGATARAILGEVMRIQRIGPQAHDMEIGYRYEKGALIADDTAPPMRDPTAGIYHPTTRPGGRLPHAWLAADQASVGTHALVRPGRFTLFCDHAAWQVAAAHATQTLGMPIDIALINDSSTYRDPSGDWMRLRQVGAGGAVLVRPDAHVAWRCMAMPEHPAQALQAALRTVLGFD